MTERQRGTNAEEWKKMLRIYDAKLVPCRKCLQMRFKGEPCTRCRPTPGMSLLNDLDEAGVLEYDE